MTLTVGSLCSGYGGLDAGVQSVLGGDLAWYSEFDAAPSAVMAHHHPGVPNLGDMTRIDWSTVEPVDVLTGGTPCQDLSHAGKRAGMTEGTRSNLWVQMREAVATLRPRLVVWENVRGALSAEAASDLEPCPGCLGDPGDRGPVLRALGRVVGDLAELGYVGSWYGLRAADVGAAHGRFRVFLFAHPADSAGDTWRLLHGDGRAAADADDAGRGEHGRAFAVRPEHAAAEHESAAADGLTLLPTPVSDNSRGLPSSGTDYQSLPNAVVDLLPTPMVGSTSPAAHGQISGDYRRRMDEALAKMPGALLPTPSVADVEGGRKHRSGARSDELLLNGIAHHNRWGDYAPAIARWEHVIGRPAPDPTEPGKNGPRLSAHFVEFLMGLPDGHVTSPDIGLTRNQQLKALGNGVVPQQCAAAAHAFVQDLRGVTP